MNLTARKSDAESLASLPNSELSQRLANLTEEDAEQIRYDWRFWARDKQIIPGYPGAAVDRNDWSYWLLLAGRGFGKTRTGAEAIREWSKYESLCNLIGATVDDARDIMIEGESGILSICPKAERPIYIKQLRKLRWPNGAVSLIFTADEPERLRGKQHRKLWADELAAWRYPEAWDQAKFGLRIGSNPQAVISTTPKPLPIIKELINDPGTVIATGSSHENRLNLSAKWYEKIIKPFEGTRVGRQEIYAELLDDYEGALWTHKLIDAARVTTAQVPELVRVVVAIDPAVTATDESDETGIAVAGISWNGHVYVFLGDGMRDSPQAWARATLRAMRRFHADRVVGEVNNGGDLVEANLRAADPNVPFQKVHASRGKAIRAEPVAALYEQGRVHHVIGYDLQALEDQMVQFVPGVTKKSPDRMDALVWAIWALVIEPAEEETVVTHGDRYEISPY